MTAQLPNALLSRAFPLAPGGRANPRFDAHRAHLEAAHRDGYRVR